MTSQEFETRWAAYTSKLPLKYKIQTEYIEVVCDARLRALRNLGNIQDYQAFECYVSRCIKSAQIDRLRKMRGMREEPLGEISTDMEERWNYFALVAALRKYLTDAECEMLVLKSQGYSDAEIAKAHGRTLGSVKKRLYNARAIASTRQEIRELARVA